MTPAPVLRLTVEQIPKRDRAVVDGVEIAWRWTLRRLDRPEDDPGAAFTSGRPTKDEALAHARELAAAHGFTPDQIEESTP